jgi:cell division protein FtsI (penicillin-binding protein 3)
MGSSLKILNTALYLDSGVGDVFTKFDVSMPLRIGRFKVPDFHFIGYPITVAEVFTESSNIGSGKMAMQMGSTLQRAFFKKIGFFTTPTLEIPELGAPLYPKKWSEATTITASYGYGVAISPLQLVTAIGGVINKGIMQKPTLIKMDPSKMTPGSRIISEETSEIMRKLMYMVVAQGTGRKAQVKGYEVGGKTGTANTRKGRSYEKGSNMTSMVGAFPMRDPLYSILIMVDRPQAVKGTYGFNAAGWNAAPIAGKVISRIAPLLQVPPSISQDNSSDSDPFMIPASALQPEEH